jgi:hypothetical protein
LMLDFIMAGVGLSKIVGVSFYHGWCGFI